MSHQSHQKEQPAKIAPMLSPQMEHINGECNDVEMLRPLDITSLAALYECALGNC